MTTKHDRDLQRAVARFKGGEKELYRKDGSKYYGDQEHAERMGALSSDFEQRVDAIISEAEAEAARHEEAALALSYEDPTAGLSSTERSRLADARVFVQEDCTELPLTALLERLKAVSLGEDRAAQDPARQVRGSAPGGRAGPQGRASAQRGREFPPGGRARGPRPASGVGGGAGRKRRGQGPEASQGGGAREGQGGQGGGGPGAQEADGDRRHGPAGGGGDETAGARGAVRRRIGRGQVRKDARGRGGTAAHL